MNQNSAIEWTDMTWNPVTGCDKVSPGCDNCYAERLANRLSKMSKSPYYGKDFEDVTTHPERLRDPYKIKKPSKIFVNSMSDLFHKDIPKDFIGKVFETMEGANWHQYQALTKRSSLMRNFVNERYPHGKAPRHIWVGVSIEDKQRLTRLKHLKETRATTRFLSIEPLLEDLGVIDLSGIDWVIAGGESGPDFRAVRKSWVRSIRDQCEEQSVQFFFKQWGGARAKAHGNTLDGRQWLEFPLIRMSVKKPI